MVTLKGREVKEVLAKPIRRILASVKDPTAWSIPAVLKGTQLARAFGAQLELFHAIDSTAYVDMLGVLESDAPKAVRDLEEQFRQRLERAAARARLHAPSVSVDAECDYPAHEAIIRRAMAIGADLIVVERHAGSALAPGLRQLPDWELVRLSPVPVLLVKRPHPYRHPAVLAALDPARVFEKPAGLDEDILHLAKAVAEALRGELHAVHAYDPRVTPPGGPADIEAGRRLDRAVQSCNVLQLHRHIEAGLPCDAISRSARQIDADIVVAGEMSRSGLDRALIGNTAEQLVDCLSCDLLVVKPAHFHSSVQAESHGTRFLTLMPLG